MISPTAKWALLPLLLCAAGCARNLPADTASYVHGVQRSASYHQGYIQGCDTADLDHARQEFRRDKVAFENDPEYRLGWVAGTENCHDTVFTPSTGDPNKGHAGNLF